MRCGIAILLVAAAATAGDFEVQGEYARGSVAAQVIALGDGKFDVVTYEGGLPGAGWKRGYRRDRFPGLTLAQVGKRIAGLQRVERKSPTLGSKPPAGAVVLFDGTSAEHFKGGRMTEDGLLMEGATSNRKFRNVRLHLEFRTPFQPKKRGQGRGNSGCYLQGRFEVQILDSFGLEGLHNECGGIYSIKRPDVNMCLPPGAWQTYDIDFTAPRFEGDVQVRPARMTVRHNGVLVHRGVAVPRKTTAAPVDVGPEPGPVFLQNHGNPVRFRNVWLVEQPDGPSEHDRRMAWWREARFGMFIHWGLYAIPAGTWKGKRVRGIGEWIMHYAQIPVKDYEPLKEQFNPVRFDAEEWVRIAKDAGMRYVVITSKHHDGFCLFDSKHTDYDIMATPFRRDIMKELADACHKAGIEICWYHSILDWHHPDAKGERFAKYVKDALYPQCEELVRNYGKIGVLWFDGEWVKEWTRELGWELFNHLRELDPNLLVNNRVGKGRGGMGGMTAVGAAGDFGTPEQQIPATGLPGVDWETCMTMNDTWGFKSYDHNWKSDQDLIRKLVDIASKGGNFLLNVGPTALGEIPAPSVERLQAMGKWMRVNGASIYGTEASPFRRLPWGRCTKKPGRLYLHVFDWPKGKKLVVPGLLTRVKRAYLLADEKRAPLDVFHGGEQVAVTVPAAAPDPHASVIVLELEGALEVSPFFIRQADDGTVTLFAPDATIRGGSARIESYDGVESIGYWSDVKDSVSWDFRLARPGKYVVELVYACDPTSSGSEFVVRVGRAQVQGKVESTGAWSKFAQADLGTVELVTPGRLTLEVQPLKKPSAAVMNLRAIKLVPAK